MQLLTNTHPIEDQLTTLVTGVASQKAGCEHVNAYGVKAGWFIPFVDKRVGGRKNV